MNRLLGLLAITFLGINAISAQSGRRVTPSATPVVASKDDPSEYSESKPRTSRTVRPAERFPGIGQGSDKSTAPAPATTPAAADAKDDGETLRIETNLITIPVSVFDRNGLYIPGLRQNDFRIFSDGIEQEIAYFGTSDKPFTVAIVIDVSPSTAYRIEEIHRAAMAFVALLEPQDSVMVIEFDHSVNVLTEITKDREKIYKAIKKADFGNGTSLYNAVDETLRKQLGRVEGRKAVVLFTDGVDTTSRKNTYESTLNYAEESDSLVFPIYYNTYFDVQGGLGGAYPGGRNGGNGGGILGTILGGGNQNSAMNPGPEAYARGRRYLEELGEVTGGRVFRPESTPGGLTAAFEGIAEELRRQYSIGFVPSDEGKPGQRKNIRVRVNRPNLILRARDSYVVGTANGAPALVDNTKK